MTRPQMCTGQHRYGDSFRDGPSRSQTAFLRYLAENGGKGNKYDAPRNVTTHLNCERNGWVERTDTNIDGPTGFRITEGGRRALVIGERWGY